MVHAGVRDDVVLESGILERGLRAVARRVHAVVELGVDPEDRGFRVGEVGSFVRRRAVERGGGRQPLIAGLDQLPDHAAAEAEPDRTDLRVGDATLELVDRRRHVGDEVVRLGFAEQLHDLSFVVVLRRAAAGRQQVDRERGVATRRETSSNGLDVIGEPAVLVDHEDSALRILCRGERAERAAAARAGERDVLRLGRFRSGG